MKRHSRRRKCNSRDYRCKSSFQLPPMHIARTTESGNLKTLLIDVRGSLMVGQQYLENAELENPTRICERKTKLKGYATLLSEEWINSSGESFVSLHCEVNVNILAETFSPDWKRRRNNPSNTDGVPVTTHLRSLVTSLATSLKGGFRDNTEGVPPHTEGVTV